MTMFKISGVWKDGSGEVTHYAFHTILQDGITRASKTSKANAIIFLEAAGNSAKTWIWDYDHATFVDGQNVEVVGSGSNKYLRSDPNNRLSDNLGHLINYDWILK